MIVHRHGKHSAHSMVSKVHMAWSADSSVWGLRTELFDMESKAAA